RRITGMVPLGAALGKSVSVVPADCVHEVELVATGTVRGVSTLPELICVLRGERPWPDEPPAPPRPLPAAPPDLADVRGQELARRALAVSAAGGPPRPSTGPGGAGQAAPPPAPPGPAPPPRSGRRHRDHDGPLGGGPGPAARGSRDAPAAAGAAPHRLHGRDGRWRHGRDAPRRGQLRPRRHPLPGRAGRVRLRRAPPPARAAGSNRPPHP